jgi:clan AA aspartic protease (TIGR02281 family)
MKMIFDTGASVVSLSKTAAEFLFANGYIKRNDLKGVALFTIADGSTVYGQNVILEDIGIGGYHIKNVAASISPSQNADLLLGMSVIQSLGKITLDGPRLTIEKTNYTKADLQKLSEDANAFLKSGNYSAALNSYMRISNVHGLDKEQMHNVAICYYHLQQYDESLAMSFEWIEDFNKGNERIPKEIVELIANNLTGLNEYKEAISCYESLLEYEHATATEGITYIACIAELYRLMKNYDNAITYIRSAISNYRRIKGINIQDIQKGYVKDDFLGALFYSYGSIFLDAGKQKEALNMIVTAAKCGDLQSIQICEEHKIRY